MIDPILAPMADAQDQDVAGVEAIDDEVRLVAMRAYRRIDLGTFARGPRVFGQEFEDMFEGSVIALSLIGAEFPRAGQVDGDDILFSLAA